MAAAEPAPAPTRRPIVPFLRLGTGGEPDRLMGYRCGSCGALFLSNRVACAKCSAEGGFEEVALSPRGKLYVYSIVHQSAPGVPVPFVSAIVDLQDGISVRCTLIDVEPDPAKLKFDMPVEMVTKTVRQDKEGNDVVAFFFRPAA
ncbi:MAG TPA: OB-fold domain-containing protein [Candidatus Binatia bacterium]|nr:OB-fold domain-containing protein [Candidatus Binatia bacterium]